VPASNRRPGRAGNILDKWILIRLNETVNLVSENLNKYNASGASAEIEKFVDDFSLWYIRRSRDRVGPAKESEKDSSAFYSTTYYVFCTLCKIMAPIAPFLSDSIYMNLTKEESVHLTDWPTGSSPSTDDLKLAVEMQKMREIVEKVLSKRKELEVPVRQPLNKVKVFGQEIKINKEILDLAKSELNIKNIELLEGSDKIELDMKITPELLEESEARELIRKIQDERKNMGLNLTQKVDVQVDKLPVSKKLIQWMSKKAQIKNISEGKFSVVKST
jgi:isoleucyl-tRNA synthetase